VASAADFHTGLMLHSAEVLRRSRKLLADTQPLVRYYARDPQTFEPSPKASAGPDILAGSDETARRSQTNERGDRSDGP